MAQNLALKTGRFLVALIYVVAGVNKLIFFETNLKFMASYKLPPSPILLAAVIAVELTGGLSILSGYKARAGAWGLFVFMIPTTLIFHTHFSDPIQAAMFMKNLAIMGGLLLVAAQPV